MLDPADIVSLTRSLKAGDASAIEVFYREYFEEMYRQAQRVSGADEQTCLDVVQDSMLKMLRCIRVMDSHQHLIAWTRKLVMTVSIDYLRSRQRHLRFISRVASTETSGESLEELERVQARLLWLEESLDRLDPDSRRLLTMRYHWRWTLQRIAQSLGLKIGTVDGRIRRLVDQLRTQAEFSDYE